MTDSPIRSAARPPLADSPWFWVMAFAAMGLVLLLAIGPKYARRQAKLELQYQARQEIAKRQVEGTPAAREQGQEGDAAPPPPGELIIGLGPLAVAFGALFVVSTVMLIRGRGRRGVSGDVP